MVGQLCLPNYRVLGPEGKCFAWDDRAHGYGRGEGVATLILKPLDAAVRDGDEVHAVIRQVGLNQDGKTTTITSPSMDAQRKLIQECYERAGLDLSETAYVEAHMTGTAVGDPIEAEAIARTFGQSRIKGDPVLVGSVKTNIGHTEPVSGIAAIIKTAFALKHAKIPPNLNYQTNNPNIPVDDWNVQVPTTLKDWPLNKPLRASVNNFGYGGTNAHVILESADLHQTTKSNGLAQDDNRSRVFVISAKDATGSQGMVKNLATYIRHSVEADTNSPALTPENLAYTLSERRSRFPWVIAVRAKSLPELADKLQEIDDSKQTANKPANGTRRPRIGFVFNGQGAQWYAMGRELIETYSVFKASIEKADKLLREYGAEWSLKDELQRDEETTRVHETNISQPINVALQLCLVDLLKSWDITPSAVTSHSSGEIAAAYSVGVLSFNEALGVVYHRGELALKYQTHLSLAGGMVAAGLGAEDAKKYLADAPGVVVACVNSPDSVTLSGDLAALDDVVVRLEKDGIFARKLKVPLAYHSHHMQHMAQEYANILESILPSEASGEDAYTGPIFASPVTGDILPDPKRSLTPDHWVRNLTSPVLFSSAFEKMCYFGPKSSDRNVDIILEVGAHSTLSGPIRSILTDRKLPYISCLKRGTDAEVTVQQAVCDLLRQGFAVSLSGVNQYSKSHRYPFLDDLPSYAWNHTTAYWTESRASREHRFNKMPPHELIGTRVSGDNGFTFLWRNFLRVSDIEWLTDHRVESRVVLPGAAYVAMAIEAIRLLVCASEELVRGYRLRDVDIMNALTIHESSSGVEVMLCLRPCSEKELDHKGWYEFEISSLSSGNDAWTMHCKGGVAVETTNAVKAATSTAENAPSADNFFSADSKVRTIDIESFFKSLREMGFYHGPNFQNFRDSRAAGNKAITNLKVTRAAGASPEYVLHPATLDSIIQAAYIDMADQQSQDSMVLPRGIRTMFVPKDLHRRAGEELQALTELVKTDKRGSTTNISVVNSKDDKTSSVDFLQINGFYVQAVPKDLSDAKGARVCFKNSWELDFLCSLPAAMKDFKPPNIASTEAEYMIKSLKASYYFICDALAALDGDKSTDSWAWHHKIYVDWMKSIVAQGARGELGPGSKAWGKASRGIKQMLIDELARGSPATRLLCRVGAKLPNIIRGEITPLELMMADNLLNEYYMDVPEFQRLYKHLNRIVSLYAVNSPGAKVLEIGAGTGGATGAVLEAFAARGNGSGTLLGHYTFTDISSGFFAAARQKFASWTALMDFNKFDVEAGPAEQGYELNSYDLIVASAVLHATKSLNRTLANVKKLLKPGGKLVLLEQTKDRLQAQIIFGTTPGWWLGEEEYRKTSPIATLETWERVLKEEGFSGIDFEMADYLEEEWLSAKVIISTNPPPSSNFPKAISIVYTSAPQQKWLDQLVQAIYTTTGTRPDIQKLDQAHIDDNLCIFLGEMDTPILDTLDSDTFDKLRNLLVRCRGILWLSCSGSKDDAQQALFAQADGLLRTLKIEDSGKRCVHLDFEQRPWLDEQIEYIVHVLTNNFDENCDISEVEGEYKVIDNTLRISRMYPDEKANYETGKLITDPPSELQPFFQPDRVLDWESGKTGVLSEAHFTDDFSYANGLESGMIEVEPKAFGLNFRDVMLALGQVEEDALVYSEMCGVVKRLGPGTEQSGLRVGDRVCGAGWGHITNLVRTGWEDVAKIPNNMSFEEAASVPTIYVTVYHSLVTIARLSKGESILIHAASGGVGQAAIMMAQHMGADIYVTCSTIEKRDFLVERYHIDPAHIFSSRDPSFAPAIMAATQGQGVDVLLNCLSGPLLKAGWECIARFGRFIEIGKVDIQTGRHLEMTAFRRCATISGIDILFLAAYRKEVYRSALQASLKLISEGTVKTVYPLHVYGISEIEAPLRQLQGGKHIGKFVVVPRPEEQVTVRKPSEEFLFQMHELITKQVVTRPKPIRLDDPNSTYLIIGGVTGIGRAVTQWMAQKGAKNILVVSRNAEAHPDSTALVQTCKKDGCHVEIRSCDVSDEKSFCELLQAYKGVLPPIRGVFTTAMVLDDTVLEHISYRQWRRAILPKVASTMNLHKHLPNLSFFLMMSSTAGVSHLEFLLFFSPHCLHGCLVRESNH